jgi:hypothetical protein
MAGSNMQKAGFCISRRTGKCYAAIRTFKLAPPLAMAEPRTFRPKKHVLLFAGPFRPLIEEWTSKTL